MSAQPISSAPSQGGSDYSLSASDQDLVSCAAEAFSDDHSYLLDMVTQAGKADRVSERNRADVVQLRGEVG